MLYQEVKDPLKELLKEMRSEEEKTQEEFDAVCEHSDKQEKE